MSLDELLFNDRRPAEPAPAVARPDAPTGGTMTAAHPVQRAATAIGSGSPRACSGSA